MNAVRDRHVPGMPLDWGIAANRFRPLTQRAAPAPEVRTAKRPKRRIEALKARWFAIGSLTTSAVFGIGYGLVLLIGSLLA